jgi:hypothetical protein
VIRSLAWLTASAAVLLADVEVRAASCNLHLVGSNGSFDRYTTGACPQQDLVQADYGFIDPVRQIELDARAAANVGSVAVRAFQRSQEPIVGQGSQVNSDQLSLACTLSGPASPVLTRLAFEVAAEANVTRNGTEDDLTGSQWFTEVTLDAPGAQGTLMSAFILNGHGSTTTPYSCSGSGVFSGATCSGHVVFARQKFFTPQVSVPTGSVSLQIYSSVAATKGEFGAPWGVFNSSLAKLEASLPSDGSPVLDLPDGYTLDCENGSVIDSVWQGVQVPLPSPPAAVPALSRSGFYALAASILSVAVVAIRRRRSA